VSNNIIQGLLNWICISIPEFTFLIIITLRIMGRKEMLDVYDIKNNAISILKIAIPPTFILNFLHYIVGTPFAINKITCYTFIYILLIIELSLEKHSYIEYPKLKQKVFGFLLLGIISCIAIELLTYPIILKLVGKTFEEIQLNIYLVILCTIPSRILNLLIVGYILLKRNNKFQINLADYIFNSKFFSKMTTGVVIGLVLFEVYFVKLLTINNLLNIIDSIYEQLFIVIGGAYLIPGLIISMVYMYTNYCIYINNSNNQTHHE